MDKLVLLLLLTRLPCAVYTTRASHPTIRHFGPNGTFYSPDHPWNYRSNQRCGQTFEVGEGQLVELNFVEFRIEPSENCAFDNVTIYDGPNNQSDVLGTYCGLTVPGPVRSTGHQLYLYFQTDDSGTMNRGYRGTWRAVSDGQTSIWHMALRTEICSLGRFNKMLFDFPGNLGHFNPMTYGQTFVVGEGYVVELSVNEFQVQNDNNCSSGNVTFYDGPNRNSTPLGTYCGCALPGKVMSTGRQLYVFLQTNGAVTRRGFNGSYRSISDVCGSSHHGAYGNFTSPDYPTGYPNNIRCGQMIKVGRGQVVELTFENFDLEVFSPSCNYDRLTIYDGPDRNAPPLRTFCGDTVPGPVRSTGRQLYLYLQSNGRWAGRGFNGTYRAKFNFSCGTTLGQSLGFIVGGSNASIQNHPWQVFLKYYLINGAENECGGSIISKNWVITAAHCVNFTSNMTVYAGSTARMGNRSQIFSVKRWITHPNYNTYVINDIALIEIDGEFDVTSATTRPVCLAGADDSTTFDDKSCVVSGWGDTSVNGQSASVLQKATITVYNKSYCEDVSTVIAQFPVIKETHLCAGNHPAGGIDTCKGDSGGPLVCARPDGTKVLAGITSFGDLKGCGDAVGHYSRVSRYRQWIDETLATA